MSLLTAEQFRSTFGESWHRVGFWPYFEAIPTADFAGHDCSPGVIESA
jgi:hypothetical protein